MILNDHIDLDNGVIEAIVHKYAPKAEVNEITCKSNKLAIDNSDEIWKHFKELVGIHSLTSYGYIPEPNQKLASLGSILMYAYADLVKYEDLDLDAPTITMYASRGIVPIKNSVLNCYNLFFENCFPKLENTNVTASVIHISSPGLLSWLKDYVDCLEPVQIDQTEFTNWYQYQAKITKDTDKIKIEGNFFKIISDLGLANNKSWTRIELANSVVKVIITTRRHCYMEIKNRLN